MSGFNLDTNLDTSEAGVKGLVCRDVGVCGDA